MVHTLTENGDHFLVADPHFAKRGKIGWVQSRDSDIIAKGGLQGCIETVDMVEIISVDGSAFINSGQQMVEEHDIAARLQGKVQIGTITCCCTARVDDHDLGPTRLPSSHETLVEHGMAPREVRADKHDEIGLIQVLICAGNGICAKRTFVAGDCGRHAKTRVCIDVG